jgi:type III pantothenate kinase
VNRFNMNQENLGAWLALMIGNSHSHWAWFNHSTLLRTWDTPHLSAEAVVCLIKHRFDFNRCFLLTQNSPLALQSSGSEDHRSPDNRSPDNLLPINQPINQPIAAPLPLWIASVVPAQTQLWLHHANSNAVEMHQLTLDHIPLHRLYPTFGIDRALALWGAAVRYGLPALVIDAGTALTFTAADAHANLVGGAILPGLGLQLRSLSQHTAALPALHDRLDTLIQSAAIPRWATQTADAMLSGVMYTLIAGLRDFVQAWRQDYPTGAIVLTGGDSQRLFDSWQQQEPDIGARVTIDRNLGFWGMQSIVEREAAGNF